MVLCADVYGALRLRDDGKSSDGSGVICFVFVATSTLVLVCLFGQKKGVGSG